MIHDPGKILILLVVVIAAAVLLAIGAVSEAAGVGMITTALGYTVGNGVLAARRRAPSPMIVGKVAETEIATLTGTTHVDDPQRP